MKLKLAAVWSIFPLSRVLFLPGNHLHHDYRRLEPDYAEFDDEKGLDAESTLEKLMQALVSFGEGLRITFELDKLRQLPPLALINNIAMLLPLWPAGKQALLEASDVRHRFEVLLTLMDMGVELRQAQKSQSFH